MIFMTFVIIGVWMLPAEALPTWLRVCLTVFGVLHVIWKGCLTGASLSEGD